MPNKFKESTIHEITRNIPRNLEKIILKHMLPLWRTDARDTQYVTRMTMNPAQRGHTKGEAANEHQMRIMQLAYKEDYIITYTNRSMTEKDHECQTGAGWVVYWKGLERRSRREGMGKLAEVYDTEMLALLRGLETAIEFQQELPNANRRCMRIILFTDNTASVMAITKEDPGSSQQISQKFVETTIAFLAPRSLKKRASQALLSHVDLPPERGSDGPSTVNICRTPVSLSIVMLTGVTFPVLNWVGTPSVVVGPSARIFFVEIYRVCPIDSLKKNCNFIV